MKCEGPVRLNAQSCDSSRKENIKRRACRVVLQEKARRVWTCARVSLVSPTELHDMSSKLFRRAAWAIKEEKESPEPLLAIQSRNVRHGQAD